MSCAGLVPFADAGRRGWIRRHGLLFVPHEARRAIRLGLLTVPAARAGTVFAVIAEDPDLWLCEVARRLFLHPSAVRRSAELLERDHYIARAGRAWRVLRLPGPDWRDYARKAA